MYIKKSISQNKKKRRKKGNNKKKKNINEKKIKYGEKSNLKILKRNSKKKEKEKRNALSSMYPFCKAGAKSWFNQDLKARLKLLNICHLLSN